MAKRVIFVDCVSTSLNFIKDAQDEGLIPVVLELPWIKKYNPLHYNYTAFGAKKPEVIQATHKYDQNLRMVKKLNPIAIIPCTDNSIELALRLSKDLGLPSSPYENFPKMRDKLECQKALKEFGIRSIETIVYTTYPVALKFFKEHDKKVIVKPAQGTSSVNVFICRNEKQLMNAIDCCTAPGEGLTSGQVLIQELIEGEEIVINTCSCRGIQKVTSIWEYVKKEVPGYSPVYVLLKFMEPTDPKYTKIIEYNSKVLQAIGLTYGLCHNEFKVDKKGPVLIEANCRTPGGSMQGKFLDFVLGHHETNVSLWAYTNEKKFMEFKRNYKHCPNYGGMKFLVVPYRMYVKRDRFKECFKNIESYLYSNFGALFHAKNQWLEKTIDYHTTGGIIFLANTNYDQIMKDYHYILNMEEHHFDKLFDIDKEKTRKANHL